VGFFEFAVSAVILIVIASLWLRRRQPSALLFGALALYAVAGCLKQRELSIEYGTEAYARSGEIFLAGTLFLVLCMDLARRAFAINRSESSGLIWNQANYLRHSKNGLVLAVLGVFLFVLDRPDLSVSWNAARLTNSQLSVLASLFLLIAMPACISVLRTGRTILILSLFTTCSVAFVFSGSRALVLSGFLLAAWMLIHRVRNPLAQIATVALVVPIAFAVHDLLRFFRSLGPDGIAVALHNGSLISQISGSVLSTDNSGGEIAISRYFVYSTTVSSDHEFGVLTSLRRLLTLLVPRIPGIIDKPTDVTYRLWDHALIAGMFDNIDGSTFMHNAYQEGVGGSLHPTLFGEMFLTGGWWSLFVSVGLLSVIVTGIDRYLMTAAPIMGLMLIGPTLAGYVFVARGNSVVGIGYFVYLFVLLHALSFGTRALRRSKRSRKLVVT
jgi:hypothetical protein